MAGSRSPSARARVTPLAFILLVNVGGCASVAAWDRGVATRPSMLTGTDPMEQRMDVHVQETREAVAGATGVAGDVSCGCN